MLTCPRTFETGRKDTLGESGHTSGTSQSNGIIKSTIKHPFPVWLLLNITDLLADKIPRSSKSGNRFKWAHHARIRKIKRPVFCRNMRQRPRSLLTDKTRMIFMPAPIFRPLQSVSRVSSVTKCKDPQRKYPIS